MTMPKGDELKKPFKEPFPGFSKRAQEVSHGLEASKKWYEQAEKELTEFKLRYGTKDVPAFTSKEQFKHWVVPGKDYTEEAERLRSETYTEYERLLAQQKSAFRAYNRASWFQSLYAEAPGLIEQGVISSLEDYIEIVHPAPEGVLAEGDIQEAERVFSKLVGETGEAREATLADWLRVPPEEEEAIREMVMLEPKPPETIHKITVNELLKSLTRQPQIELPEDMTIEQRLKYMSIMDVPEETLQQVTDYSELLRVHREAILEQNAKIEAVLSGEEEWGMPEMGIGEKLKFFMSSPMQMVADALDPYIKNVSYPLAGFASYTVTRLMSGTQDIEKKYAEMKALGYNWWDAMSKAYEEWDLAWYYKLPIEIVTDPLTYVPGLALKIPGKLLQKIPITSIKAMGGGLINLNKGLYHALDLPFDAFKAFWGRIPKTFNQATRAELNHFRDLVTAAMGKNVGKIAGKWTVDDVAETLAKAEKTFLENGLSDPYDSLALLGAELGKHTPIDVDAIKVWSGRLGKVTEEISEDTVFSVNWAIRDYVLKIGSPAEIAKRLAIAFGIEDTPAILTKIIKDLGALRNVGRNRVAHAVQIGKSVQIDPVNRMLEYLVGVQKGVYQATARSTYAKGAALQGIVLGLMNKVSKYEQSAFRMTMDRWLVRPMAEAYLGSVAYPLWNALEGIFVSAIEGVVPRMAKQEAFQRMFIGLIGVDTRVMEWAASDIVGLLGAISGREGVISLLPGKIPEKLFGMKVPKNFVGKDWAEWTGRKFIEWSDTWGTGMRANFLTRKMSQYLAEYSYNVAGRDLNLAFRRLMRGTPSIKKEALGLTKHELEQDMFARVTTGLREVVLDAKNVVNNNSLMQGEALKILRQAEEIAPEAMVLGKNQILSGDVFKAVGEDKFAGVNNLAKTLADTSIENLRAQPKLAPESFRYMADLIEAHPVNTVEDLMQAFQHFEVLSETASQIPQTLLSQVFDEANELKRLGKFNQLETLWRTSRADVETVVDNISASMERIRSVIRSKSGMLKGEQQSALVSLIDRNMARTQLQEQFMKADGRLLDDFWKLSKTQRTGEAHTELRAFRQENFMKFKEEDAVLGANDFLMRKDYADLYYKMPPQKLQPVDAGLRAMTADDCAKILGCNVDALTTGLMESMVYQDKVHFVKMVKKMADSRLTTTIGVTEDKIAQVYDDIIRGMRMSPERSIAEQKILQQVEGVRQRMIALKMKHSLTPDEEKAFHAWVDQCADGVDDIFGKEIEVVHRDFGLVEKLTTEQDVRMWEKSSKEITEGWEQLPERTKAGEYLWRNTNTGEELPSLAATHEELAAALLGEKPVVGQPMHIPDNELVIQLKDDLAELGSATEAKLPPWLKTAEAADEDILADMLYTGAVPNVEDAVKVWFHESKNDALQVIGWTGQHDKKYLAGIHKTLRDHYESDFVEVSRGTGTAKERFLDREYTNVTSSRQIAKDFTDMSWSEIAGKEVQVDSVLVKVDDIVAIGSVDESELIIPTKILRERINNPLKPPTKVEGGVIMKDEWEKIRQLASESAHKDYYKAFADYTNENIIDAMGKTIYPFWCVPEYVPVLTRRGWVHYSQLQIGEDVLTVNPRTLVTEWQPVQELADFDYDGELMVIPAKSKDIEFTPEHRWLVINKYQSIPQVKRGYRLSDNYDLIPRALPHKFPSEGVLSVRDARILGWLVTDGHISKYQSLIYQSYEKYLIEVTELVGTKATYNKGKTFKVRVPQEDMKRILAVCPTKEDLPKVVTMLSEDAAKAMWDAMLKAEGNCYIAYTGSENWSFKQNPGPVMQAFQVLSVLCGKAITATEDRVNILCNRKPYLSKEVRRLTTRHYKGKVWCPVTANGTWFANFNGSILPTGNTYHMYRWFFLPRTFFRHPGIAAAWGKYTEYSDYGYVPIPGTDLQINPFVGSAFGATFSLARHDFKSYYENLGALGEVLDFTQRRGFYPGIHFTLPVALTSVFSGRPPELGETLAPIQTVGLNLLVNSEIPGVSDAAKWLKDKVFHANFHDYYTATVVSSKQVQAGGGLIGGQSGVDLWFKKQRGEKLTDEEQTLWDKAYEEAAWYGVLRSEFPVFRFKPEEQLDAYKQVTALIEAQTGMTAEYQDNLWRHNLRPTDVLGGIPLELRNALDQMWQWRIYFGRGAILMPPEYSDIYNLVDKFWGKVENYQLERLDLQMDTNIGFLTPTKELHFSGGEWRQQYAEHWSSYNTRVEALEKDPEFVDAVDAMTPEGQVRLAKELGFAVPPTDPTQEAIRLYFDLELEKKRDPYTGEEDYDYLGFWLKREAVRMALPDEMRADFDAYIRRYQTPMEVLFKRVNNEYFRGYRAVSRIVLEEFTEEEKALIAEFYADGTSRERKNQIKAFECHAGKKLISYWDSRRGDVREALRRASPELDFWLYVFDYIESPKTDAAKKMIDAWEKDKTSIVRGISETPLLEARIKKIETKEEGMK